MFIVLGIVPLFVVIAIIWPIVAIAKQRADTSEYPFTSCVAAWYAQIMAMLGIVVFTVGIGYLFQSLIGFLDVSYSYGSLPLPIMGTNGSTDVASLVHQRLVALNLVLGYVLNAITGIRPNAPFGEFLGFALAFTGAFFAHIWIWRSFPGGTWWSPPDGWPRTQKRAPESLENHPRQRGSPEDAVV